MTIPPPFPHHLMASFWVLALAPALHATGDGNNDEIYAGFFNPAPDPSAFDTRHNLEQQWQKARTQAPVEQRTDFETTMQQHMQKRREQYLKRSAPWPEESADWASKQSRGISHPPGRSANNTDTTFMED